MAKQTEGEITIKLRVSAKGHQNANKFRSLIKQQYGVFQVHSVSIVEDSLKQSTTKAVKDVAARELNTLRSILTQAIPDGLYHKLKGDKGRIDFSLNLSDKPIKNAYELRGISVGNCFSIVDGEMTFGSGGSRAYLSLSDPQFLDKLKKSIKEMYDAEILRRKER